MADSDKRLPPTEKRLRKAREEGQVARSRELGNFATVAACGALLVTAAGPLGGWMLELMAAGLRFDVQVLEHPQTMLERLPPMLGRMALVVLPVGLLVCAVAILAGVLTGGWNFTLKPLAPNFGKLNPLSGVKRLFSTHQLTETLKAVLLTTVLATIGTLWLQSHLGDFGQALALPLPEAFVHVLRSLQSGLVLLLLAMALFAVIDVPLQRHLHARQLRMSVQEVKQEMKDAEGNVEVKAKIKARMREMLKRRMMAAVPTADLVVMNPTHYAVALKYDDATMGAPRVVAKGADLLALRIRDLARDSNVPVLESPPLARALYAHAELDREIPAALFSAVAQVLAYVYQLRNALAGRATMPTAPNVKVPDALDPHHPSARQGKARR